MRTSRIKVDGGGVYHCISRVVDRRMIMGETEREKFCSLMRGAETFCGVGVLTYAALSNHFHILVEVPERKELSEAEIVERLPAIYDRKKVLDIQAQWALWRRQGQEHLVQKELDRLRARMYDVSAFMKTVKQRFTQWYNRREKRCGTLWEDRFKSVLIEPPTSAQSVRQGARAGLATALGEEGFVEWRGVAARYRLLVHAAGEERGLTESGAPLMLGISVEQVEQVVRERGELPLRQVLRCRVRYFSDGVAIGSKAFVEEIFRLHRDNFGPKRKDGARPLRFAAWDGLCSARDLRLAPISASGG